MIKKYLLSLMLMTGFVINGIFAQDIKLLEGLKTDVLIYPVKGRQGLQLNQVISFGDFTTSKIKKGWTKTSSVTSGMKSVSKSSQKFSFTQFAPDKSQAEVACLGELSKAELEVIKNLFSVGVDFKNCFTGSISVETDSLAWEFVVIDPDSKPENAFSSGFIRHGNMELIEIYAVTELEGKKSPAFCRA